jgi:hypothetical protein
LLLVAVVVEVTGHLTMDAAAAVLVVLELELDLL